MKHAYLIIAHKCNITFYTLLKMIDDKRNDIFIHMDKKNTNFRENDIRALIKHSDVFFTRRINVQWGVIH